MKAKLRIFAVAALCIACLTALVGCSSSTTVQTDEQSLNRQYMASVNSIMETLQENLTDFTAAVKDGEVVSLDSQLSAVDTCVNDLDALDVPDAMKDIHKQYTNAATELQTALKDYVQLYEDVKAPATGSYDYSDYADRLADIQSHYDAGIKALQDADKAAQDA